MDIARRVKEQPYWYHRIKLPDGTVTPGWAPICAEKYALPKDMSGLRVLDIGAWDGYWTWEALKRGASEVVAIDDFSDTCGQDIKRYDWETFDICRHAFGFRTLKDGWWSNDKGQKCLRQACPIETVTTADFGVFDIVLCFGTLYLSLIHI